MKRKSDIHWSKSVSLSGELIENKIQCYPDEQLTCAR
jgi:hypothetical protein